MRRRCCMRPWASLFATSLFAAARFDAWSKKSAQDAFSPKRCRNRIASHTSQTRADRGQVGSLAFASAASISAATFSSPSSSPSLIGFELSFVFCGFGWFGFFCLGFWVWILICGWRFFFGRFSGGRLFVRRVFVVGGVPAGAFEDECAFRHDAIGIFGSAVAALAWARIGNLLQNFGQLTAIVACIFVERHENSLDALALR